ncbi:hypothetical protein H0H81_007487 [Sphagnurus paluster]|uniref:Uncharacterized protein n=1 Tax=Sphagnurus paluster TaxID=117069 RepID=A0A9P7KJ75_9AGAR|nr:hypothetical protein H0H81_007487 [Sphagnurus paluster]
MQANRNLPGSWRTLPAAARSQSVVHGRSASNSSMFAVNSSLYDDPAFSPDPHAHPFFATTVPPAPVSFSPLKGDARPPLNITTRLKHTPVPSLRQHPTPMFSDDHSSTTHETSSSSNHTSLTSPPTSTDSHSSPWPAPSPAEKAAQPPPWPPETQTQKKKKNITMFWRRTPPETVLESAAPDLAHDVPQPKPRSTSSSPMSQTPRPAPARILSAPKAAKPIKRPILPTRPATTAGDSKPPPSAARRALGGLSLRPSELDRIDELDESNPLGLPVHHGGPYEAAHRPITQEPIRESSIGSQYQWDPSPIPKPKKSRNKATFLPAHHHGTYSHLFQQQPRVHPIPDMAVVPIIPPGVSLNLSPGQILPRNFYYQLAAHAIPPPTANTPGWPPHPQQYPANQEIPHRSHRERRRKPEVKVIPVDSKSAHLDGSQHSIRHRSLPPPEYSPYPTDGSAVKVDRRASQIPVSFVEPPAEKFQGLDLGLEAPRHSNRHSVVEYQQQQPHIPQLHNLNLVPDHRAPTPAHRHTQTNPRLPPRMQALQMQNGRPDESHRRSPRPFTQELSPIDNMLAQPLRRRRSKGRVQSPHTPVDAEKLPLFVDNNGFPASVPTLHVEPPPLPNQDQIQSNVVPQQLQAHEQHVRNVAHSLTGRSWYTSPGNASSPPNPNHPQDHDARSTHPSVTSSARSTQSGGSRAPPHHLPKRLVMPAPLQTTQFTAPRHQPAPRHMDHSQTWQPQLRPPSPPIAPTPLETYTHLAHAQDIPMDPHGRKLRKRHSVQVAPPVFPITQPIDFEPSTLYSEILPPEPARPARKPDKASKKVLSKRRSDF